MKKGFTLVEILIVIAVLGLIASIVIPSFIKSRKSSRQDTCIKQLKEIQSLKAEWVSQRGNITDEPLQWSQISKTKMPVCPAGGTYTIGIVGKFPTCSITNDQFSLRGPTYSHEIIFP